MFVSCNQQKIELPPNSTAKDLAEKLNLREPHQAVAVSINGTLKDLSTPLEEGDTLQFWNFDDPQGKNVFWHTSAHVLAQAVLRLWPDAKPTIGPAIENGFYYDFAHLTISDTDFEKIEEEANKILRENYATKRAVFDSKQDALSCFSDNAY